MTLLDVIIALFNIAVLIYVTGKMDLKNSNYPSEISDVNEKSNNDVFEKQYTNFNYPPRATDFVKKSYNTISKKQSVKSYATRVFQESTVGIVSSIVASHSNYRRFFKLLLFSLCVSGFLYQCITFLNHVLEYPAVMDLAIDRSNTYNIPAYTFCINNM